jgi:uncharacterized protein YdeI (YjbR/CyaY-like superfamily)
MANERTTEQFAGPEEFRAWLREHHDTSPGIWMKLAKKGSGLTTVTYDEAVEVALTFGWIDGQARPGDDTTGSRASPAAGRGARGPSGTTSGPRR